MAKNTIVIRSVIVPMANLGSNFVQLMSLGVGARDIAKGFPTKLVEINQHLANLDRKVEIKALKARYRDNPDELKRVLERLSRVLVGYAFTRVLLSF